MLKQVNEARNAFNQHARLKQGLLAYCENARTRYTDNPVALEILSTIIFTIKNAPTPDDRETYINEKHYSRRAKWNNKAKALQERERRRQGVPTMGEHLAKKRRQNDELRHEQMTSDYFTEFIHPNDESTTLVSYQPIERKGEKRIPLEPKYERPKPGKPAPIIPNDSDEPPLEFETEKNAGGFNFAIDIPKDPYDNGQ
jgi:hypothetical protein